MVDFSIAYFVANIILGEDVVHKKVIQKILTIMKEDKLKVWFVWIPREGKLSYNDLIGAIINTDYWKNFSDSNLKPTPRPIHLQEQHANKVCDKTNKLSRRISPKI